MSGNMDTTTVIDKYTQDISNLPLEIKYMFEEIRNKDIQLQEARRRYQTKDNQIHKLIKQNGTLVKHPKEQQLYSKIEEDMQVVEKLQREKILLANSALFLISKHLFNFETDITKLERDDLLPPIDNVYDTEGDSGDISSRLNGFPDSNSVTPAPRVSAPSSSTMPASEVGGLLRKAQKRKAMMKVGLRPNKRSRDDDDESGTPGHKPDGPGGDDADNTLYCICQRVSFGEMIACDNDDCRFEWFHWSCVGITSSPKDNEVWYCPDCAPRMEKRKKKKKF